MKINSIGIESYRQAMGKPQVENRPADNKKEASKVANVGIPAQSEKVGSKLAVRLQPGTFVDMLSAEEKQAVELFFEKFNSIKSKDAVYARDGESNSSHLGKHVDVKL